MIESFIGVIGQSDQRRCKTPVAGETDATIPGVRTIAINVLGFVGYGSQTPWGQQSAKAPPGYQLSYMDAILAVVENLVLATFVSVKILTSPVMPKSIQRIGFAVFEFSGHVKQLLEAERASERPSQANLMSTLIEASSGKNDDMTVPHTNKLFLTEPELSGNLFQFTVAGFDTTANTMAYAITLLATYPEWQDWIREELDQEAKSEEVLDYKTTFPKLKRCLALMVSPVFLTPTPQKSPPPLSSNRKS